MPVKNIEIDITNKPFENIALALSGGGYRATAFHLGVFSYLNTLVFQGKPLLSNLRLLSTISGGTITGVYYAYSLSSMKSKEKGFEDFFRELYIFLKNDELLKESVRLLNIKKQMSKHNIKGDNVITIFASLYDNYLFKGATFEAINQYSDDNEIDFMFNATDIERSLPFRFQTRGKFGHGKYIVDKADFEKIKLSDVVAASSCFPGGFEPMFFPTDFLSNPSKPYQTTRLMDGGVIDNQGIASILLGEKGINSIGTIIISDVSCEIDISDDIKKPKEKENVLTRFSSSQLKYIFGIFSLLSFVALFNIECLLIYSFVLFMGTIFLVFSFAIQFIQCKIRKPLNNISKQTPPFYDFYTTLKHLKISEIISLLIVRLSSVYHLNDVVFLTRMRGMNFNYIMDNPKYKYRSFINSIYDLKEDKKKPIKEYRNIRPYIEEANKMPTTLWFNNNQKKDDKMLRSLVVAGQVTICYNLLEYLEKVKKDKVVYPSLEQEYKNELSAIEIQLISHFEKFKQEPEWLLNQLQV